MIFCVNGKKYTETKFLGKGSRARVFEALSEDNEKVTIKIIDNPKIPPDKRLMDAERESLLSRVDHPNVRKFIAREANILVLEYLDGIDGSEFKKQKSSLNQSQAEKLQSYLLILTMSEQLLSAIVEIHNHGIVHRDIKPNNIFINSNNEIKLIDFGLSYHSSIPEPEDHLCGTPIYVDPCQYYNSKRADLSTDLYSFGTTVFELLTGVPLFTELTIGDVFCQKRNVAFILDRLELLNDSSLIDFIKRLIHPKQKYREICPNAILAEIEKIKKTYQIQNPTIQVS